MARSIAAGALGLLSTACDRSGEVVVVLDTTMRGPGVEVVAYKGNESANSRSAGRAGGAPRATDPLDDTAAILATRFRQLRDSINAEVALLENADRRTRAYAVRYAEIRRRTLAAEQLRARRDSLLARASAARTNAGSASSGSGPTRVSDATHPVLGDIDDLQRHPVSDSMLVLELTAGPWSIGAARNGRLLGDPAMVTVVRGSRDTLRISGSASRPDVKP